MRLPVAPTRPPLAMQEPHFQAPAVDQVGGRGGWGRVATRPARGAHEAKQSVCVEADQGDGSNQWPSSGRGGAQPIRRVPTRAVTSSGCPFKCPRDDPGHVPERRETSSPETISVVRPRALDGITVFVEPCGEGGGGWAGGWRPRCPSHWDPDRWPTCRRQCVEGRGWVSRWDPTCGTRMGLAWRPYAPRGAALGKLAWRCSRPPLAPNFF